MAGLEPPSPPNAHARRRFRSYALLIAALMGGMLVSAAVGTVGLGLAFEDHCLIEAGDRASRGPVVNAFPPSIECSYESDGRVTTERETGPVIAFGVTWLFGTVAVLGLIAWFWSRLGRTARRKP